MSSNLIPRAWFAEQVRQSDPFAEISAKLAKMSEDISTLRAEMVELRAEVQAAIARVAGVERAVGQQPEGVDCGCLCGFAEPGEDCDDCDGILDRLAREFAAAKATGKCEYGFGTPAEHVPGCADVRCVCTEASR